MKKTITAILALVAVLFLAPDAFAQKNASNRFVIDGHAAFDIPDSCYNVYITDIDMEITDADFVTCVPVKDRQFRFETDINTIKRGRLQAIFPGNQLCPAWIDLYFIPGFTLDLTVCDGYCHIANQSEYNFMTNAWLNERPLAALYNSMGLPAVSQDNDQFSAMQNAISAYKDLLDDLKRQLKQARSLPSDVNSHNYTKRIIDQMGKINLKIQEIIDKYAASIKY